jgi:methylmalonyl-CoA mutase, N-terminal domain
LISIRTMQVLSEETNVTSVVDPLGGSYYVEWLTSQIEKGASEYCKKIMDMGGTVEAIKSGYFLNEFRKANYRWDHTVDTGEKVVIGVNKYRLKTDEVPYRVPIYRYNPHAGAEKIAKLKKYKQERDNKKVQAALARMEKACQSKDENMFEYMVQANKAGATIQESYDVCRKIYGAQKTQLMKV